MGKIGVDAGDSLLVDGVMHASESQLYKTVVTCKIKYLQNICKNVLVFYFTCNHRKTFAKHLQKCFSVLFYM